MSRANWVRDRTVQAKLASVDSMLQELGRCVAIPGLHAQLLSPRAKRLRPALMLLAARFGRVDPGDVLVEAAAGVELLHEATLYHDDIVDEAETRRGFASTHRRYGAYAASCAGSELLYRTVPLFADLPHTLRRDAAATVNALCTGQLREIESTGSMDCSVRRRVRIMRDKTARLFVLAATIGGELSHAGAEDVRTLRRFGATFGLAFQLADDVRDIIESESRLGRPPGSDLRDGVYTLPVVLALQGPSEDSAALRRRLVSLTQTRSRSDLDVCVDLVRRCRAIDRAIEMQRAWIRTARSQLDALGGRPREAVASFRALLDAVTLHDEASDEGATAAEAAACEVMNA